MEEIKMKKVFLALLLVMALAGTAFATPTTTGNSDVITNTNTATATGGAGGSATIQRGAIENSNSNLNIVGVDTDIKNSQSQKQGQAQGQIQGQKQNNDQTIAPSQTMTIMPNLPSAPGQGQGTWLSYIHGGQRDVTAGFPQFVTKIKALSADDVVSQVLYISANNKFKNIYDVAISGTNKVLGMKWPLERIRRQVVEVDAQKSWNTSGNIAGSGSAFTGPTSGAGALTSIIPAVGGAKVQELYTVVFVLVKY
jgi:hypothetical protein